MRCQSIDRTKNLSSREYDELSGIYVGKRKLSSSRGLTAPKREGTKDTYIVLKIELIVAQDLKRNLGRQRLYRIASRRKIKMLKPDKTAA